MIIFCLSSLYYTDCGVHLLIVSQQSQLNSDMSPQSEELRFAESEVSNFLKNFSPIYLHHKKPGSLFNPCVFWSEYEGSENNSSSADVGTPINIHDKIISALSNMPFYGWCLGQFWAPVTIGGRRLLSTSAQPFSVELLCNELAKYRLNSEKYKYNIDDANKVDIEPDQMIKSGGPATAFLNRRISMDEPQGFLLESDDYGGLNFSVMIPICFPPQSDCVGILEFTFVHSVSPLGNFINEKVKEIKKAGLEVFYVQHLIPYKTISGLELAKDRIEKALKVVGESHELDLAQVWIPYEDKSRVFLPYSLEDTQTKQLLAIKLTSYYGMKHVAYNHFERYLRFSDVTPSAIGEEFPLVTLQDYKSRYISKLRSDMVMYWGLSKLPPTSAFVICLRSNETRDCNYLFEFMWNKDSKVIHLEALLLTLKRCLPSFKFASGEELGDELDVHIVDNDASDDESEGDASDDESEGDASDDESEGDASDDESEGDASDDESEGDASDDEIKMFKLFQGNRSMVVDYIAHSKVTCKTTPKVLPQEVIEKQFANAMKDAAKNLDVSLSAFKRKHKALGIPVVDLIAPSTVTCKTAPKNLSREVIQNQFGKTMKDAAESLNVSLSTLKRKFKELDMPEWPGPNYMKRNANGSSIVQRKTNEEDNGAIEDTSTVSLNKNELTIKAEYKGDITKFHLPISQATFVHVEKEIGKRLELSDKTYKLKYLDEDGDWINLKSDEEMTDCIKSSRKSNRIVVRIQVLPM